MCYGADFFSALLAVEVRRRWAAGGLSVQCVSEWGWFCLFFRLLLFSQVWMLGVLPGPGHSTSVNKLEKLPES